VDSTGTYPQLSCNDTREHGMHNRSAFTKRPSRRAVMLSLIRQSSGELVGQVQGDGVDLAQDPTAAGETAPTPNDFIAPPAVVHEGLLSQLSVRSMRCRSEGEQ
jgi:hypothetical protein